MDYLTYLFILNERNSSYAFDQFILDLNVLLEIPSNNLDKDKIIDKVIEQKKRITITDDIQRKIIIINEFTKGREELFIQNIESQFSTIDKKNRFIVNLNNYTSFLLFGFEKHVVTISDTLTESIKNSTASEFINTIYFYTTVFDIGLVKNGTSRR